MPSSNLPLADESKAWNGSDARRRMLEMSRDSDGNIMIAMASRGFALPHRGDGSNVNDWVLPFADVIDGELKVIRGGVIAGIQSTGGARTPIDGYTSGQISGAREFLQRQLSRFGDDEMSSLKIVSSNPKESDINGLTVTTLSVDGNGQMTTVDYSLGSGFLALATLNQMLKDGESIAAIEFDAISFIYGANENFVTFMENQLGDFADSYGNKPFLRNHDHGNISSRDGTIIRSTNKDGAFEQRIRITTDEGIKDFAQGRIDRFSIAWQFDDILCSLDGNKYVSNMCNHVRGKQYDGLGTCHLLFTNPRGTETSAVNVPAVSGTHILSINDLTRLDTQKMEVINMDDETTLAQDEQEMLSQETSGQEVEEIALLAEALHLDDIDSRIGQLEAMYSEMLSKHEDTISQLTGQVEGLSLELAKLNGELPPKYQIDSDSHKASSWAGYRGSVLNYAGQSKTPELNREVRKPNELAETVEKVRKSRMQRLADEGRKPSPKEVAGAAFLDSIQGVK